MDSILIEKVVYYTVVMEQFRENEYLYDMDYDMKVYNNFCNFVVREFKNNKEIKNIDKFLNFRNMNHLEKVFFDEYNKSKQLKKIL